jgi:glycosyltransferase involved in cell wall biosynthesis
MIKVVDVVYHCHNEYDQPQQVLNKHKPTLGFIEFIKEKVDYKVVRHLNYEGYETIEGISYAFFRRRNAPWQIPFKTHRYIKSVKPDVVIVHGFIFPLQVITLRKAVGKNCAIVLQHHADKPANSIRKIFQKIADRSVTAYMFTSAELARPWLSHHIIRDKNKIIELSGASASIEKKDQNSCKKKLGMVGTYNFLWVGRLDQNKDPITVLNAFARYVSVNASAKLFMVYQSEEVLANVKKIVNGNSLLRTNVYLIGRLSLSELSEWYNAADFYISGSHEEAVGYALLEAMSVGCIPVVTSIPAFKKILGDGKTGFMFEPGNENGLFNILNSLCYIDVSQYAVSVEKHFHENMGFKHVAEGIASLCTGLVFKN